MLTHTLNILPHTYTSLYTLTLAGSPGTPNIFLLSVCVSWLICMYLMEKKMWMVVFSENWGYLGFLEVRDFESFSPALRNFFLSLKKTRKAARIDCSCISLLKHVTNCEKSMAIGWVTGTYRERGLYGSLLAYSTFLWTWQRTQTLQSMKYPGEWLCCVLLQSYSLNLSQEVLIKNVCLGPILSDV